MRVLVTGSAGFLGSYLVPELLGAGHEVIGVDNLTSYGAVAFPFDSHPHFTFVQGDASDADLLRGIASECDQLVAAAGLVGRSGTFHGFAYDLLAANARINAATFDAAIDACLDGHLERIVVISSTIVYEHATVFPTPEGAQLHCPPPSTTFGFDKLALEYFARGAWEQYRLPYTIIRPTNVVGAKARRRVQEVRSTGSKVRVPLRSVIVDLIRRILEGQDPVRIRGGGSQLRHFTHVADVAHGVRLAMESGAGRNNDFNIASSEATTIVALAEMIWRKINDGRPFHYLADEAIASEIQARAPDVAKARSVLGFEAERSLDEILDELIPWVRGEMAAERPAERAAERPVERPVERL
jgi:UDP-glucose 4-epimerase